nr:MAG TPA_asm: hypothetical protein [Caudoviricetes sp.]
MRVINCLLVISRLRVDYLFTGGPFWDRHL